MTKFEELDNATIVAADYEAPTGAIQATTFKVTRWHVMMLMLGVLALMFIAFITLARSIEIKAITANLSDPDRFFPVPSDVSIDALLKLPLGNRILVLPGRHTVTVSAEGYTSVSQALAVGDQRHQQFELVLTPLPGNLEITLSENISAQVLVDDQPAGTLPDTIRDIPAGKRNITVDAPLYRSASQTVLIRGKGQTQSISVSLEPAWAEYSFTSNPAGAAVLIDGERLGETPLTAKIEEGSRQLIIKADKFKPYQQEIGVTAQQDLTIPTIELTPADGILSLNSKPVGAAVIVNNEFLGTTPLRLEVEPDTGHTVQVYQAGYKLSQETINLAPEQQQETSIALQPDLVSVRISVAPNDANVYVDGQARGTGSQTLTLNTLPHTISVRKPGYVTQTTEIIPTRSNKQIVSVKLLTEEQHYWAQIPDSYTSKAGHQMKLFKQLGKVRMGSSRREDGRRANEAVYQVELTKPFYVSLHETTNKQFRAFKRAHNAGNYKQKSLDANRAPAVNVSWQEAALYCNWLSKAEGLDPFYQTTSGYVSGNIPDANGYRLLTEAEWAWLARNKGDQVLIYPWGSSKSPGSKVGNFADVKAADLLAFTLPDYDDGYRGPSPVGRFPPNHRGLYDIDGNAAEWVNDWYSAKGSSEQRGSGLVDPLGPDIGEFHTVRGASWAKGHLPQLRLAYRDYGAKGKHDVGFRVARYAGLNKK